MVVYDKNSDGFVSFFEFGLSTSTSGSFSTFIFFILHFVLEIIFLVQSKLSLSSELFTARIFGILGFLL